MALAAYAFEWGKAPPLLSIVLLIAAWIFVTVAVYRHNFFEHRSRLIRASGNPVISAGILVIFGAGWLILQPEDIELQSGYLQLNKVDILMETAAIAPGRQFGGNFHALNPGPGRAFNCYGYAAAYVEHVDEKTNDRVRALFDKEVMPFRKRYHDGEIKGPQLGVGQGLYTKIATGPLSQHEFEGIMSGKTRVYFVTWLVWMNSQGREDSTFDCRWLQTPPKVYREEDLVWHICVEPKL